MREGLDTATDGRTDGRIASVTQHVSRRLIAILRIGQRKLVWRIFVGMLHVVIWAICTKRVPMEATVAAFIHFIHSAIIIIITVTCSGTRGLVRCDGQNGHFLF
jgi:hypothetical protein